MYAATSCTLGITLSNGPWCDSGEGKLNRANFTTIRQAPCVTIVTSTVIDEITEGNAATLKRHNLGLKCGFLHFSIDMLKRL
jgi:hypothetical protein